jgi:hypothetical protein
MLFSYNIQPSETRKEATLDRELLLLGLSLQMTKIGNLL